MKPRKYRDFQGRILFVASGLDGRRFMTVYQKPPGGLRRVATKWLPLRDSREQAQADLDRYARLKCMEEVREDVPQNGL